MKRYLGFCAVVLCGVLASGALSGCTATEKSGSTTVVRSSDGRPSEVQVKPRTRAKVTTSDVAITIAKAAPSPTPSAKGKKSLAKTPRGRMKEVPVGTNVPFYFKIEDDFWPTGVEEVYATVQCFEVTSIVGGGSPAISLASTALSVFPNSTPSTSKSIVLTPGGTVQVNLNFPTSTAGNGVAVIISGIGEDANANEYNFSGANISVVNP